MFSPFFFEEQFSFGGAPKESWEHASRLSKDLRKNCGNDTSADTKNDGFLWLKSRMFSFLFSKTRRSVSVTRDTMKRDTKFSVQFGAKIAPKSMLRPRFRDDDVEPTNSPVLNRRTSMSFGHHQHQHHSNFKESSGLTISASYSNLKQSNTVSSDWHHTSVIYLISEWYLVVDSRNGEWRTTIGGTNSIDSVIPIVPKRIRVEPFVLWWYWISNERFLLLLFSVIICLSTISNQKNAAKWFSRDKMPGATTISSRNYGGHPSLGSEMQFSFSVLTWR